MKYAPFNALHVGVLYDQCLWRRGELDNMRLSVLSATGKEVVFHRRKIELVKRQVGRLLLNNMSDDLLRSCGSKGRPWMLMRSGRDGVPMGVMENVDKFFTLSQACEFLTVWIDRIDGLDEAIPFVIVEDRRIRNLMQKGVRL